MNPAMRNRMQVVYVSELAGLTPVVITKLVSDHNRGAEPRWEQIPAGENRASFIGIHHQAEGRPLITVEQVVDEPGETRRDLSILTWAEMLTMPNLRAHILMLIGSEIIC